MTENLPEDWEMRRLDEVAEIIMGQSPSSKFYNTTGEGLPFFQGKSEFTDFYPKAKKWCSRPSKMAEKDDVLISVRAPVGPTNFAPSKCCIGRGLAAVRPLDGISSKYILYYLRSIESQVESMGTGTTFKAISGKILKSIEVPIAPAPQRERIVAEIEKQFSRLDKAVASLKRVKANLMRYKAAVLKAAVEGRLPVQCGSDAYIEENWRPIGELITSIGQGWSPKCERAPSLDHEEWGVIKTTAIQPFEYVQGENKRLPEGLEPRPKLEILKGDLLTTRAGPRKRVGVSCLVRSSRPKLMICDKVYRLRCNSDLVRPGYLELVLNAPQILDELDELKTGISDSGVNLTQKRFLRLRLPVPSYSEQSQVEEGVERLVSTLNFQDRSIDISEIRTKTLRQSILHRAFSGVIGM